MDVTKLNACYYETFFPNFAPRNNISVGQRSNTKHIKKILISPSVQQFFRAVLKEASYFREYFISLLMPNVLNCYTGLCYQKIR